ncbi:MAG TPA: YajQ family cyclic di-GMP-binding protein [Opitutaceae bacterium]
MPSFDITCEVDRNEVKNATNQVRKELQTRFDFKGVTWEMTEDKNTITLSAESDFKLRAVLEILRDKLARRGVNPKNVDEGKIEISSAGRARQVLTLKEGIPGDVGKQLTTSIRGTGIKAQAAIEAGKVRVSSKKRNDLQSVIAHVRGLDLPIAVEFGNFRE